jgi:hypothetical protein
MKSFSKNLLFLYALGTQSVFATTLLTDDFSDGNRTSTPNGGNWYSVGTNTVTFPDGGMNVAPGGAINRSMQTTFSPASLAVGDSITATLDLRFTDTIPDLDRGFRIGLFNSNGTSLTSDDTVGNATTLASNVDNSGYWVGLSTGPTHKSTYMYYDTAAANFMSISAPAVNLGTEFNFGAINDAAVHSFSLAIARTSTGYDFTFAVSGTLAGISPTGFASRTYTGTSTDTFDTFAIMTNSSALDYTIDNVAITVIPEPGPLGLLALGGLAPILRRRRRA